ncbi:S-adenosylmethionine decarboxylase [Apibacter raozihei]|uniref:S-adenosylmethionine decarboxylase family protein n=1 Tax=Apibacter TaxID=1778601 RepID=UPI000FE3B0EA|nr:MULTISPECIES: S-adenosylmethionine decarboxylase [Apibacter]
MNYLGLHSLLTLKVNESNKLLSLDEFLFFTKKILVKYELEKVGCSSFVFDNGGFTSAFCLKESHICIHTWPELSTLTLDIYLCNYFQNNNQKVKDISEEYIYFFNADIISKHEIYR